MDSRFPLRSRPERLPFGLTNYSKISIPIPEPDDTEEKQRVDSLLFVSVM